MPPLAHWLFFLPIHRQSLIGADGHMSRGEFLPPVPLPRRMWAGSRIEFLRPLRIGADARREVKRYAFRAMRPLFDTAPFEVCGLDEGNRAARLWTRDAEGAVTMEATAGWG